MTLHDDADTKYAAYKKRWVVIDATAKEWMEKLQSMVTVWKKQAETVEKVNIFFTIFFNIGHFRKFRQLPEMNSHLNILFRK